MTPEQTAALDVARALAAAGIPVFAAPPDASKRIGFDLPLGWQGTVPDPRAVDAWRPGWALCMVTGHGLDLLDMDLYAGADLGPLTGTVPTSYAVACTPSGGLHSFIRSIGVRSANDVWTGVDVKSGLLEPDLDASERGRGFAFIAPTVKASKVTGEPGEYRWTNPPDLDALSAALSRGDASGARLAELIAETRSSRREQAEPYTGPPYAELDRETREAIDAWVAGAVEGITAELRASADWGEHETDERGRGWEKLQADAALRLGQLARASWNGLELAAAEGAFTTAAPTDDTWGPADVAEKWRVQHDRREPAGLPDLSSASDREAAAWEALGLSPTVAPANTITPELWNIRRALGEHPFDPEVNTDQDLAAAVLGRTHPVLRFAADAGAWLLRTPEHWEERRRLSPWAVSEVAQLMPRGDEGDKERSGRWARFRATAGARAIAGKMDDLVASGTHPCALRLSDLDRDPEVLWAGGLPWTLRGSTSTPVVADYIDPATPHMHTAALAPRPGATPLWDAFLAAVWPDEQVRRWALRVLAVTLTGYPDRALPILLGETGRGKTQVIALLMNVLGTYAHAADPRLMGAADTVHASIVYALKGRRLSFIDEGPREGRWAQERLKQLTGGAELTANQMHQDPITFSPTHTLVLTANDEPLLVDPAIRSRARLIPCDGDPEEVRQARAAIGHTDGAAWRAEAPGVLAGMIVEAARWLEDPTTGLASAAPGELWKLAEEIGAEQDPVGAWVEAETEPDAEGTASRDLYQAFVASCRRNSMRADAIPTETKWGRAMDRLGHEGWRTKRGKRRALRLRQGGGSLPTVGPNPPAATQEPPASGDGFSRPGDGLVTGSPPNPSPAFPQVNPSESVEGDGCDGFSQGNTYAHTHTHAQETGKGEVSSNPPLDPSPGGAETGADLRKRSGDGLGPNPTPPTPTDRVGGFGPKKRARTQEATEKAATARAEKRAAAIAAAAGERVPLPALVQRTESDLDVVRLEVDRADGLLTTITAAGHALTVDVETTGYPVGHQHFGVRTVQLGNERFAVVLDPHRADQAEVARRHLERAAVLHAHSATADLIPLAELGLIGDLEDAWSRMHDTVIAAKLADPASTGSDPGLKHLSVMVLGEDAATTTTNAERAALFKAGRWLTNTAATTELERSGWAQVDPDCTTMIRYAASDVLDTAAIAARLPEPPSDVVARERAVQRMTARITHHGLRLDGEHIERLRTEHTAARAEHAEAVRAFGVENPGSGQQVAAALTELAAELPRTATGRASVAVGVLEPLAGDDTPAGRLARAVLDYRHHDTALGTFLEPYHQLTEHGDGRVRPTIYTLGTDTGRMSSVRPNAQQLPREGGFRACFTADPGHVLVSADFSGVELRVAAALSGDTGLAQMIRDGADFHWMVARQAFGPDATKAHRYIAKRGVFGRIYGGGVPTLAQQMGVTEPVAQQVVDALDHLTPGLSEWSRQVRESVKSGRKQFPTYAGRTIHLPPAFPHKAPNYCIQGTARELLVDALLRWADTRWGEAVLLPVHDELVVMVPEADGAEATAELERCMTTELFGVPIVAEAGEPSFAWQDSV